MKFRHLIQFSSLFLLSCCALTHYDSLDQEKQTEISVSSNVPAELWIDGKKIQDVAKEHLLKQTGMGTVTLKAPGYQEARVLVYQNPAVKKNVTSHESSVVWTTEKGADISSDLSDVGASAATTSPTSTVMFPINLVKFAANIVATPFSFTKDFNPFGYYLAYDKNQFYVEMIPVGDKKLSLLKALQMQTKVFVLKNYPELAKGNREYIVALSDFSGVSEKDIQSVLDENKTAPLVADAIANKIKVNKK